MIAYQPIPERTSRYVAIWDGTEFELWVGTEAKLQIYVQAIFHASRKSETYLN